jgi:hypothetical protein
MYGELEILVTLTGVRDRNLWKTTRRTGANTTMAQTRTAVYAAYLSENKKQELGELTNLAPRAANANRTSHIWDVSSMLTACMHQEVPKDCRLKESGKV